MTSASGALANVLDAFARRDLAAAAAEFSEHATYREARKPAVHGRAAIAAHFARYAASGAAWEFVVDEVIAQGERARVVYRFAVEGKGQSRLERAGYALVRLDQRGHIAEWREYEG